MVTVIQKYDNIHSGRNSAKYWLNFNIVFCETAGGIKLNESFVSLHRMKNIYAG